MNKFTLDKISEYKMFFLLKKIKSSSSEITLFHQTLNTLTPIPKTKFDVFEIGSSDVIIAFRDVFEHVGKHNYIANNGFETEFVGLQPFERIEDFYLTDDDDPNLGVFIFLDSRPIVLDGQDWRCDGQLYGARIFSGVGESDDPLVGGPSELKIYEPIVGVNGIAYIAYAKLENDEIIRNQFVNNAVLPSTAATFPELMKLIFEWSSVSTNPFNNHEPIAIKASEFIKYFSINDDVVAGQQNMQIYEYLNGSTNARERKPGIYQMNSEMKTFIESSVSYMTFSKLVEINDKYFNARECAMLEIDIARKEWQEALITFNTDNSAEYGDVESVCSYLQEHRPGTVAFVRNYFTLLAKKKQLLEKIIS